LSAKKRCWSAKLAVTEPEPALTTAIALGANLGDPAATLTALRPLLIQELESWMGGPEPLLKLRWSPLFRTAPVGGPPGQPPFLNAVLLVERAASGAALQNSESWPDPLDLLVRLQSLEARFGRQRLVPWGPRSLDLDLLWCGATATAADQGSPLQLELPHPRLRERTFVLAPLAAIEPGLVPPGGTTTAAALLQQLLAGSKETPPQLLPGRTGWPEWGASLLE